jgi:hypothetical protein
MPVILATWESEIRKIAVQGQPRQIVLETPISKITRAKWTVGVVQVVECLLCKGEALSSNPSFTHTHTHTHTQKYIYIKRIITEHAA